MGRPSPGKGQLMEGEKVTDPARLDVLFVQTMFYYQFNYPVSRVMQCTDEEELAWLKKQVRSGSSLTVSPA